MHHQRWQWGLGTERVRGQPVGPCHRQSDPTRDRRPMIPLTLTPGAQTFTSVRQGERDVARNQPRAM